MALVQAALETKLKAVFASMRDGSKTNEWMAQQIAAEIKTYILSGQVSTTDAGAAPAGVYAGAGSGTMTIESDLARDLADNLKTTFEAEYTNNDLASHMATDINAACTASDIVATTTTGTITTPAGVSSPFAGMGKGKFSGNKTTIETMLQACFTAMNTMSNGGDDYFASQLAAAVDSYLKAGQVSVTLQAPLAGNGAGSIA